MHREKEDEMEENNDWKLHSHPHEKARFVHQPKWKFYNCGEEGHYKRNCTKPRLNSSRERGGFFGRRGHGRSRRVQVNKENNEKDFIYFLTHQVDEENRSNLRNKWFLDYLSSRHINKDAKYLVELKYAEDTVKFGEGSTVRVEVIGKLRAKTISDGVVKIIEAIYVEYVPKITTNLLLVSCLKKKDIRSSLGITLTMK